MIYLASPYSHPDPLERQYRYDRMVKVAGRLLGQDHFVYSPIVHCHPLALATSLPTDFTFWQRYNLHMLEKSDELWVIQLDGWHESLGVQAEIIQALRWNKPVVYVEFEEFINGENN